MNISDDDWKNFLSGPSLLGSSSQPQNKGAHDLPSDFLMDFGVSTTSEKAQK